MQEFDGLRQFAAFCEEQALTMPERMLLTAGAAATILKTSIKKTFGDQSKLAPLSGDSTLQMRDGDTPLLITGELLRDSIESMHEAWGEGAVAGVGSSEPVLTYHEHGFVTGAGSWIPGKVVPPRPAFAIGVYEALPTVKAAVDALLFPGFHIRNIRGRFSSFSNPESMLTNAGDPSNAVNALASAKE